MTNPAITIILSVYNGSQFLDACLTSIQQQTYTNWHLICINDASADSTADILTDRQQKLGSNKMTIITNPTNLGLTKSLNLGLKSATTPYIARLDADDIWHPDKLQHQINYLKQRPQIGVLGTWYQNQIGNHTRSVKLPTTHQAIQKTIFRRNPFGHSTVLIKKSLLDQVGGYNESLRFGQDRDLWFRLFPLTKFANLPQILCTRRVEANSSTTNKHQQILQTLNTTHHYLQKYQASPVNYFYLITPLLSLFAPTWFRQLYRQIR